MYSKLYIYIYIYAHSLPYRYRPPTHRHELCHPYPHVRSCMLVAVAWAHVVADCDSGWDSD